MTERIVDRHRVRRDFARFARTTATPRRSASANAKQAGPRRRWPVRQVRQPDRGRRRQAGSGTVSKIDPDTQEVEVTYDDGGDRSGSTPRAPGSWPGRRSRTGHRRRGSTPARSRASRAPPRTRPRRCCPVAAAADGRRGAATRSIENYPNFIEKERAGARRAAGRAGRPGRGVPAAVRGRAGRRPRPTTSVGWRRSTPRARPSATGSTRSTARSCPATERRQAGAPARLLAAGTADHRPGPVRRRAGLHGRGGRGQPAGRAGAAGHGPGQHRGHRRPGAALHRDRLGQRPEDPAPAPVQLAARDRGPGRGHVQRHPGAGQDVLHHARGQGRGRGRGQGGRVPGRRGAGDLGRVRRADRRRASPASRTPPATSRRPRS